VLQSVGEIQVSAVLEALCLHPVELSHQSFVQTLSSSQARRGATRQPWVLSHDPLKQTDSLPVAATLRVQLEELSTFLQCLATVAPLLVSQISWVQALKSLQSELVEQIGAQPAAGVQTRPSYSFGLGTVQLVAAGPEDALTILQVRLKVWVSQEQGVEVH